MKKLLFAGAAALTMFTATAQSKLGYINANELMGLMPEAAQAQTKLQKFNQELSQTYQDLTIDFNNLDSSFSADSARLSPTMREIKRKDLVNKFQAIQNFQQTSQEQMQAKQEEVIAPIREKALTTIRTVAKENGYTYIFQEENLLVAPPADNILPLVKAKLGIKDAPKPTQAAPVKKP
jgi:outer membrane protein